MSKKKLATLKIGGQTPNIRDTLQLARAGLLSEEVLVARRVLTSLIKEIVIRNDAPPEIVYRV